MRKTVVLHGVERGRDTRAVVRLRRFAGPIRPCKTKRAGQSVAAVLPNKGTKNMERVTLRIPKQQIEEVERMVETGEYPNRSEAIRAAVREKLNEQDAGTERPSEKRKRRTYKRA